jgi:hypothetical protein
MIPSRAAAPADPPVMPFLSLVRVTEGIEAANHALGNLDRGSFAWGN